MNSLSWMIYAADVVGGIGGLLIGIVILSGAAGIGMTVMYFVSQDTSTYSWEDRDATLKSRRDTAAESVAWGKRFAAIAAGCALVAALIPSTNTIYAIAASEMGESALKSDTGGKAVKALNAWLDRQISDEPEQSK